MKYYHIMIAFEIEKYIDSQNLNKLGELFDLVNEPRFQVKDIGLKYRVINHWDEKKLIRYHRENELDNRKFSFVDFIWVKAINELRTLGIGIDVLQKITTEIYTPIPIQTILDIQAENLEFIKKINYENKEEFIEFLNSGEYKKIDQNQQNLNFNLLQLLITEAINSRNSVSIIIYKDAEWLPFVKENEHLYDEELLHKKEFTSHIRINLTEIIFNYLAEDYFGLLSTEFKFFTPLELYIFSQVKQKKFKRLIVELKNKKSQEIKINTATQKSLIELFKKKAYKEFIFFDKNNNEFLLNEKIFAKGIKDNKELQKIDFESLTKFQFKNLK